MLRNIKLSLPSDLSPGPAPAGPPVGRTHNALVQPEEQNRPWVRVGPQTGWEYTFTRKRLVVLTYRLHPLLKLLLELLLLLPQALQRLLQLISLLADEQQLTLELLCVVVVDLGRQQTVSLCLQVGELRGQSLQLRVNQKSNLICTLSSVNENRKT